MNRTNAGFPWLPTREYADRGEATLHVVYPAREQMPPPPQFVGSLRVNMLRYLDPHIPDLGVLELSQPLVYGNHGWIFSHDGFLLPEQSWYGREVERMHLPRQLPAGTPLPGTSLSLASDFAGHSYGHYLLDSIPRLHLFLAAGFTLDAVDPEGDAVIAEVLTQPTHGIVELDATGRPNYRYTPDEVWYIFDNSDAQTVVYSAEFRDTVAEIRPRLPGVKNWIEISTDGQLAPFAEAFDTLATEGDGSALDIVRSGEDQLFIYTGGTTGMPKGVMWNHHDLREITLAAERKLGPVPETLEALRAHISANPPVGRLLPAPDRKSVV